MDPTKATPPSPPPTARAAGRRRVPVALLWMVGWLVAIEGAARLLWRPELVEPQVYAAIDPGYGYGFEFVRPICEPRGDRVICRPTQYRPIPRQDFARSKGARTIRAFTVGGSHAAGYVAGGSPAKGKDAYTQQLARALAARCPAIEWEIVNLAVPGDGSGRARLAAEHALGYDPDLVIIDFGGTNEYEDERDWHYREALHAGLGRVLFVSRAVVLGRKLLAFYLPLARPPAIDTGATETEMSRDPANLRRWRDGLRANYEALLAEVRAEGVTPVVVGRAFLEEHALAPRFRDDRRVFQSLGGEGVLLLDAHAAFQAAPPAERARLFAGDRNHYSVAGHARVAEALAELLLASLPAAAACEASR